MQKHQLSELGKCFLKLIYKNSESRPELRPELIQNLQPTTLYELVIKQLKAKPLHSKEISEGLG